MLALYKRSKEGEREGGKAPRDVLGERMMF